MDWNIVLIVVQVAVIACVLVSAGAVIVRAFDSIEGHRAALRAKHANDVRYLHVGPGHYLMWRGRRNGVEYKEIFYTAPASTQPAPMSPEQRVPIRVNGELVKVLREPGYEHAVEVLMQTRRHPDYGDRSQQIVPANKFSGSNETWQIGKNYLDRHFGMITRPGIGTFCGPDHESVSQLLRAVTTDTPLPHQQGGGGAS
jgi:hypothetical protein